MTTADALDIYRTFVGTITAAEDRRQRASTGYLAMIAAVGTVTGALDGATLAYACYATLPISLTWWFTLVYFRRLAKAKFRVIKLLEEQLPFSAFDTEWNEMIKHQHVDLSILEMLVPIGITGVCAGYLLSSHPVWAGGALLIIVVAYCWLTQRTPMSKSSTSA